jgi:hypothetical protein
MAFRLPGASDRTTLVGATGTGKTTCGAWLLAQQRLELRPWVVIDLKREEIFDFVGFPPIRMLAMDDKLPAKPGLYLIQPRADEKEQLDKWLWRVWTRGNMGLFVDEATLMPKQGDGYVSILQQGRAKLIPVIQCTQRPVDVARQVFSEASFFGIYRITDKRDQRTVEGFVPGDMSRPMLPHHWLWHDVARNHQIRFGPIPGKQAVAAQLRDRLPMQHDFHPFRWIGKPTTPTPRAEAP